MKAISLTQPWATLVAIGAKRIETRSWKSWYTGPIAIHAAKTFPRWCRELALQDVNFTEALCSHFGSDFELEMLPLGAVVCTTRLYGCMPTSDILTGKLLQLRPHFPWTIREFAFGDYSEGRWAWVFEEPTPIAPVRVSGSLGIWDWNRL